MDHEVGDAMRIIMHELDTHNRLPQFLHHTQMKYVRPIQLVSSSLTRTIIMLFRDCFMTFDKGLLWYNGFQRLPSSVF